MPITDDHVAALRAHLAHDGDEHRRLRDRLEQDDALHGYVLLASAGFVCAVKRRFSVHDPVADIVKFVSDARAQFDYDGEQIDPRSAERLIMTVFTEEPVDDIDDGDFGSIEMYLLAALILDEDLDDAGFDAFLADARALADEWTT